LIQNGPQERQQENRLEDIATMRRFEGMKKVPVASGDRDIYG
jgi:hypothetical protein